MQLLLGEASVRGSVSQINLVPTGTEGKVIPQAGGQAKQDSLLRMLHI